MSYARKHTRWRRKAGRQALRHPSLLKFSPAWRQEPFSISSFRVHLDGKLPSTVGTEPSLVSLSSCDHSLATRQARRAPRQAQGEVLWHNFVSIFHPERCLKMGAGETGVFLSRNYCSSVLDVPSTLQQNHTSLVAVQYTVLIS